jgi:hypothetical protein
MWYLTITNSNGTWKDTLYNSRRAANAAAKRIYIGCVEMGISVPRMIVIRCKLGDVDRKLARNLAIMKR